MTGLVSRSPFTHTPPPLRPPPKPRYTASGGSRGVPRYFFPPVGDRRRGEREKGPFDRVLCPPVPPPPPPRLPNPRPRRESLAS